VLELEVLELDRAHTEVSVQYVEHNLLQADSRNAEDDDFLRSASRRFGLWFSKAGNGVSHPTHMQRFGIPGKTMVGSDSHTPAAGSLECWRQPDHRVPRPRPLNTDCDGPARDRQHGAELGATTTVLPSDGQVRAFLRPEQREGDFAELPADTDATYDETE
jgi:aconitate hydratase